MSVLLTERHSLCAGDSNRSIFYRTLLSKISPIIRDPSLHTMTYLEPYSTSFSTRRLILLFFIWRFYPKILYRLGISRSLVDVWTGEGSQEELARTRDYLNGLVSESASKTREQVHRQAWVGVSRFIIWAFCRKVLILYVDS